MKVLTIEKVTKKEDISKKVSSKQLEAKITAYTIIFAAIIVNILWWVGSQSILWKTSPAASLEAVRSEVQQASLK